MVEEIPFAFILDDAVVGGPAYDGGEDYALIDEGAVGVVADGVAEQMGVAGGVGEVIFTVVFMHPGGFEEAMRVVGFEGVAFFVEDYDGTRLFGKLEHVGGEAHASAGECGDVAFGEVGTLEGFVVAVTLELSAPDSAEVEIIVSVGVGEHADVNRVAAAYGVGLWYEGSFGTVGYGYSDAEDVVLVLEGKVEVVTSVFFGAVAVPELSSGPGYVGDVEGFAVVGDFACHGVAVDGEYVHVFHDVLVAVVVFDVFTFPVVGGVDVNLAVVYVYARIGHVVVREKITFVGLEWIHKIIGLKIWEIWGIGDTKGQKFLDTKVSEGQKKHKFFNFS